MRLFFTARIVVLRTCGYLGTRARLGKIQALALWCLVARVRDSGCPLLAPWRTVRQGPVPHPSSISSPSHIVYLSTITHMTWTHYACDLISSPSRNIPQPWRASCLPSQVGFRWVGHPEPWCSLSSKDGPLVHVLAGELLQWLCLYPLPALENALGMSRRRAGSGLFVFSPLSATGLSVWLRSL
jgi:hypothetical protein